MNDIFFKWIQLSVSDNNREKKIYLLGWAPQSKWFRNFWIIFMARTSEQFASRRMTKVRLHSAARCYERNGRKDNRSSRNTSGKVEQTLRCLQQKPAGKDDFYDNTKKLPKPVRTVPYNFPRFEYNKRHVSEKMSLFFCFHSLLYFPTA